jgi:hypothetical protein
MNRFSCPNCGSERTRTLPIIHASGTSTVRLTSIYVDTDEDVGVIPSYGKSQTAAARMAAPPAKKEAVTAGFFGWILLSALLCFIALFVYFINQSGNESEQADQQLWAIGILFSVWLVSWIIPLIPRMQTAREYNENTLPKLMREWEQSFACERCGTIFLPEGSEKATFVSYS